MTLAGFRPFLGVFLAFSILGAHRAHAESATSDFLAHLSLKLGFIGKWEFAGWNGGGAYPNIVPDPNVRSRVYLVSDVAGIWRSENRGNRWAFSNRGLANLYVPVLAVAPSNSEVIYVGTKAGMLRSNNGGQSWNYLRSTKDKIIFQRPESRRSIAIEHFNPDRVYTGARSGEVHFSADGGNRWSLLGDRPPFGANVPITALCISRDGNSLLASSSRGVARFNRERGTWDRIGSAPVTDLVADFSANTETIYATWGKAVAYTKDFGNTWRTTPPIFHGPGQVYALAARGDQILVGWQDGWNGTAFLSADRGVSWRNLEIQVNNDESGNPTRSWMRGLGRPNSVAIDPYQPNVLYFADWWGVWRSDDGGNSWAERVSGAPNSIGSQIVVAPDMSLLACSMDNGLLRSTDGGNRFEALVPRAGSYADAQGHVWRALALEGGRRIVATNSPWNGSANQVLISEDGGRSFRVHRNGLPAHYPKVNTTWEKGYARALAADPNNPRRLYLGIDGDDGGGLFVSDDGGDRWTRSEGQPGSLRIYNGLLVDPTDSNRVYWAATGNSGGVFRSLNQGRSWEKVLSAMTWVFDLAISKNGTVYAAGAAGEPAIYVSKDKGNSWQRLVSFPGVGTCKGIAVSPLNENRLFAGVVQWDEYTGGKIYTSSDGGKNWKEISENLPDHNGAVSFAVHARDKMLYVYLYSGSIYKRPLNSF